MGNDSPSGRRGTNPLSPSLFKRSLSVPDISWRSLGHRHKFLLYMLGLLTLLCTVYLYFAVTMGTSDSCSGLGGAQRVRCQLHANALKADSKKAHHRRLLYVEDADASQEPVVHSGGSKKDLLEFLYSWHASIKDVEESEITKLKGVIASLQRTITSLNRSNRRLRKTVTVLRKYHHTFPEDDDTPAKPIPVPPTTTSGTRRATRLRAYSSRLSVRLPTESSTFSSFRQTGHPTQQKLHPLHRIYHLMRQIFHPHRELFILGDLRSVFVGNLRLDALRWPGAVSEVVVSFVGFCRTSSGHCGCAHTMAVMEPGDVSYLGLTALITAVFQFTFFVVAATLKFDKVTDFAGVFNFVILAVTTFFLNGSHNLRQMVLTSMVVAWGLRLSIFLLLRILEWGEDNRMDDKRGNIARFAVFWTLQGVWVWTVSLPVTIVNGIVTRNPGIQTADILGWVMWGIGVTIEAVADQQKLQLKRDPASQRRWCDVGVWKWSRHPNYFGEIFLWFGVFVSSTPVLKGGQWGAIASPTLIAFLLLFVSGIPLLEASADKKHGGNPAYRAYKNRTSPLIPLPPALYGSLPKWLKTAFLFEFPLYTKKLAAD